MINEKACRFYVGSKEQSSPKIVHRRGQTKERRESKMVQQAEKFKRLLFHPMHTIINGFA
jgi:hypothetical protein